MTDGSADDAERAERRIERAKRKARSELKSMSDWTTCGYAYSDSWLDRVRDAAIRIDYDEVTREAFVAQYESKGVPVVITGNVTSTWAAHTNWTMPELLRRYGREKFKIGQDDEGYPVKVRLAHFAHYAYSQRQRDDSPLYIFDSTFGDNEGKRSLLGDFSIPKYFEEDLFSHAGHKRRPPYRWFVAGPRRSGTGIHIDPLGTSAWNALIFGHKRWALFPPGTPKELVCPKLPDDEGITWFDRVFPRTQRPDWPTHRPLEILQRPGDVVFVPGGWWHVVVNLDNTVAVTQNFCSSTNFRYVWRRTRKGRPKMSRRWLSALARARPDLAQLARAIDAGKVPLDVLDVADPESTSSSSSSSTYSSTSDEESARDVSMGGR
eukprot:Opistho-2@92316